MLEKRMKLKTIFSLLCFILFLVLLGNVLSAKEVDWDECEKDDEPDTKFLPKIAFPGSPPVKVIIKKVSINKHLLKLGETLISEIEGTITSGVIRAAPLSIQLVPTDKSKISEGYTMNFHLCTKLKPGTKKCPLFTGDSFTIQLKAHLIKSFFPRKLLNIPLTLSGIVHENGHKIICGKFPIKITE